MVRLVFALACVAYLWFQSLFVHTAHTVVGQRHVFAYNLTGILLACGFNAIPIGCAWFLWRRKDRLGAGLFLLFIPLFVVLVMPQLFMERTEVTPTHLIHRREPPHTGFNVDVAFDDIVSAVELEHGAGTGFVLTLKDGRTVELPANTVLTAARDTAVAQLRQRNIPIKTVNVIRKP
jgi:hypothetical protein